MIKHDFNGSCGAKAVGFSDTRFEFVIQTLHGTQRELSARLEPVEDEGFVRTDHPRNPFDKLRTGFCIGSRRERIALVHHCSMNFSAHTGETYSQNSWNSSLSK